MLELILLLVIGGAIIGALGRLVIPGPNPIGFIRTVLAGWAGAFLGGLVGRLVFGWRYRYAGLLGLAIAVLFAALIIYAMEGGRRSNRSRRFSGGRWQP
jgi:uncharacterized membrane protein YeaQ/YmgE (transglycosylase-associated protein family)